MPTTAVLNARSLTAPRGARVAASLFLRLLGWMFRPAAPQVLTRSQEASNVREMAWQLRAVDPRYAADLFAAADRHDALDD